MQVVYGICLILIRFCVCSRVHMYSNTAVPVCLPVFVHYKTCQASPDKKSYGPKGEVYLAFKPRVRPKSAEEAANDLFQRVLSVSDIEAAK